MNLLRTCVSVQSRILVIIGLLDLISTIILLEAGIAVEANPVMRSLLPYGWLVFSLVKAWSLMAYVAVLTWYRARRPRMGALVETFTIAAYLFIYATSFTLINS
ncbi:MAG: hypothetical protein IT209_08550 [Armatimonadetes bacterium]|nr:hypothetical protein [Armatimonadota bacterium]